MTLTLREKMILEILYDAYPRYVSLQDLTTSLAVSLRTVQRDVKQLEKSLKGHSIKIDKKQNQGLKLVTNGYNKVVESLLSSSNHDLNQIQRVVAIYHELLTNEDYSTVTYLSESLNVSAHTINQDLDLLSNMIQQTNLKLIKKPGVGLEIEGLEKEKRIGFVHLMSSYFQQDNSYSITQNEFVLVDFNRISKRLIEDSQKILFQQISKADLQLTDSALFDLWMYIMISILRHQKHPIELTQFIDDSNHTLARIIFDKCAWTFEMTFSEHEILFFASMLRSSKRTSVDVDFSSSTMRDLALELIDYVSLHTGYYFDKNQDFIQGLITHLRPLISRLKENIFVGNPIKEQIKRDYTQLFVAIQNYFSKEAMLEINEDEIGFLTLHFGANIESLKSIPKIKTLVICTSGIATSKMLTKRLLDKFPQMTIIEQSSLMDIKQINPNSYDLVISTIKLKNPNFEYVHVSPLLEKQDADQIEKVVNQLLLDATKESKPVLTPSNRLNLPQIIKQIDDLTQAADQFQKNFDVRLSNNLNIQSLINSFDLDQNIIEDLLSKQEEYGFALPNMSVALVHTRANGLSEVQCQIYQNRSDIIMKAMDGYNSKVNTILLLVTPMSFTPNQLELISFISISLLEEESVIIYSTKSRDQIIDYVLTRLSSQLQNMINKQWRFL